MSNNANKDVGPTAGFGESELWSSGIHLLRTLQGQQKNVNCLAFDPTGKILASAGSDQMINLWGVNSGQLIRTLKGHTETIRLLNFDAAGGLLASGGDDGTLQIWDVTSGKLVRTLAGHAQGVTTAAFGPTGETLMTGGRDNTVRLWDVVTGKALRTFEEHQGHITSVGFDPVKPMVVSASADGWLQLWDLTNGRLLRSLDHNRLSQITVKSLAFHPRGTVLATGGNAFTVQLWESTSYSLIRTLEGHTDRIDAVAFLSDGEFLASQSADGMVRLWNSRSWEPMAAMTLPRDLSAPVVVFHPKLPLLAMVAEMPTAQREDGRNLIHICEMKLDVLLSAKRKAIRSVHHMTAKIVLVGDSGVGKTGLGWRLAHGDFKEHASTHGQQFWVLDQLGRQRSDGTECEAILWDLAGQTDYRLTHALFVDDADLALVLFDPTDGRDPLHGVEFWLKQLRVVGTKLVDSQNACPTILVGARSDRGDARLSSEELDEFCVKRGIVGGYLSTSALKGEGLGELLRKMRLLISWDEKPAIVTTITFKRIKDYVLQLKESPHHTQVIVSRQFLREWLEETDDDWVFTDAEMMTAVGHLANYGYVRILRTSKGEEVILLAPELLNNLAASFVLEARRNPLGLGSLEENRLVEGRYEFRELENLPKEETAVLIDSVTLMFIEHNICFRETDPLGGQSYLVFPELINMKGPTKEGGGSTDAGVAYTVSGAVENVYASLVVLLGYSERFRRTKAKWRSQAQYEVGDGLICGFRQDDEREGELDLVLYFGTNVGAPVRSLFQGLFESFLARRNLTVFRYEPVICENGHTINRAVVRERLRNRKDFTFCAECGEKAPLYKPDEPIQLTQTDRRKVDDQRRFAERRTRFEQAVFQIMSFVKDRGLDVPECFISYAWGDQEQERWVERTLAPDLQKAGIKIVLDRWENSRIGMSVPSFIQRIERCDRVIVVGTPLYRLKYENKETSTGYVVAAEVELISNRLLGTNQQKESVLPLLLAGEKASSLPPLLHSRVYADFRDDRSYFISAFDLILSLYHIAPNSPPVGDLRDKLKNDETPS